LDLDEIPVIAAGFSVLDHQRRHLGTARRNRPPVVAMRNRPSVDICDYRQ
jgi:hypothetical protein